MSQQPNQGPPPPGSPPEVPPDGPPPSYHNTDAWNDWHEYFRTMNSFTPGQGVDHTQGPPQPPFPFGPEGPGPWGRGGRRGIGGRHRGGYTLFGHPANAARSGRGGPYRGPPGPGYHGRPGRDNNAAGNDDDLYDVTAAAAFAEAEMESAREAEKEKEKEGQSEDRSEKEDTPSTSTVQDDSRDKEHPDPPEEVPSPSSSPRHGHRSHYRCRRGRPGPPFECPFGGPPFSYGGPPFGGPFRGRGHRHGPPPFPHHGPHGPPRPPGPPPHIFTHPGPPPFGYPGFNVQGMIDAAAKRAKEYLDRLRGNANNDSSNPGTVGDDENIFTPPVDIFQTENGWTLHVALPGAKKEDIAVHWDEARGMLTVSGVVGRPGDEEFLAGLVSGERRVGFFERRVAIPPVVDGVTSTGNGEGDIVDGEHITAKMENGILVVVVPKVEKEWTEIRKVDIE